MEAQLEGLYYKQSAVGSAFICCDLAESTQLANFLWEKLFI